MRKLSETWRDVRPATQAETRTAVEHLEQRLAESRDELRAVRKQQKQLADEQRDRITRLQGDLTRMQRETAARFAALASELQAMSEANERLQRRELQLRAILRRDVELEPQEGLLADLLADNGHAAHVSSAVAAAPLETAPFPHIIVDDLLPASLYDALLTGLPPAELYNDQAPNKAQLRVPFTLAPAYSRRVWRHMTTRVIQRVLRPALIAKFNDQLRAWIRENFPAAPQEMLDGLTFSASDGRILIRTRGYRIPPHRDPKWGFLTGLLYLARPGDDARWGTQLYHVEGDERAATTLPHWIDPAQCRAAVDVGFKPNRLLVFLNSHGAHGAAIPDDESLTGLQRFIYQFRIGPPRAAIRRLVETLPEAERPAWQGKVSDY